MGRGDPCVIPDYGCLFEHPHDGPCETPWKYIARLREAEQASAEALVKAVFDNDTHKQELAEKLTKAIEAEETARRELDLRLEGSVLTCEYQRLERELQGLRGALQEIAEHPHNEYAAEWLRDSSFATGHTNGHRCCAIIASTALAATNESPEGK